LKTGNNVSIETYTDEVTPRLLVRLEAPRIKWIDSSRTWIAESAIIRDYSGESIKLTRLDSSEVYLLISHHEIEKLKKSVKEMTYDELKDVRQETIEYYGNYAFPFANLIVVLFGVPFASVRKKGGIAIQISAALVVSFLYIIFSKVSQTIGFYIDISPILVGWIANLLFLLGSVVVLFKTRT
jgi:lipopolysaccharide export system permease protein